MELRYFLLLLLFLLWNGSLLRFLCWRWVFLSSNRLTSGLVNWWFMSIASHRWPHRLILIETFASCGVSRSITDTLSVCFLRLPSTRLILQLGPVFIHVSSAADCLVNKLLWCFGLLFLLYHYALTFLLHFHFPVISNLLLDTFAFFYFLSLTWRQTALFFRASLRSTGIKTRVIVIISSLAIAHTHDGYFRQSHLRNKSVALSFSIEVGRWSSVTTATAEEFWLVLDYRF